MTYDPKDSVELMDAFAKSVVRSKQQRAAFVSERLQTLAQSNPTVRAGLELYRHGATFVDALECIVVALAEQNARLTDLQVKCVMEHSAPVCVETPK